MKVLAVTCHPDDLEICAGGTIRKYVKNGWEVTLCHVANGDKGDVSTPMAELGAMRNREAEEAGQTLGAKEVISLNVGDLMVNSRDEAQVRALTEVICRTRPDVILTHNPDDYMKDHTEVSKLVFDASFSATIPNFAGKGFLSTVAPIYYMESSNGVGFIPDLYVDITCEMEDKLRALRCHQSQMIWLRDHDHVDAEDMVRTAAKYRGYQCGVAYAEGFRVCRENLRQSARVLLPMENGFSLPFRTKDCPK